MTIFALEALDAAAGDALIVHFGDDADPEFVLIDGGFGYTCDDVLRPRLEAIRADLDPALSEPLTLACLVVSHIDNDHINGVVRLLDAMNEDAARGDAPLVRIQRAWHNSFDDAMEQVTGSTVGVGPVGAEVDAVAAGVKSGRRFRDLLDRFGLGGNQPVDGLLLGPHELVLGDLVVTVVGPGQEQVDDLRDEWAEHVRQLDAREESTAEAAAYLDSSIPNLSSIVFHLRHGDHTMLLTGDARGDHTLVDLERAGLLSSGGAMSVDVLKLPHHGSFNNVEADYFERIVADHYVISADGAHDNPDVQTLELLTQVNGAREYTIYLTNPVPHALAFLDSDRDREDRNYEVVVRADEAPSVVVALAGRPY